MIRSVAFAGIGAVGAIYAELALLYKAVPCFAVVRDKESYKSRPVSVNGRLMDMLLKTPADGHPVDLVIVAVKWNALDEVLEQLKPFVGENTIILSLLNGVSSEAVIESSFPQAKVLLAMCSGIDSSREGRAVSMRRRGRIVFGEADGRRSEAVEAVRRYFDTAGIPNETPEDMLHQMWWKLMVNVGMNQVSAVTDLDYEGMRTNPAAMEQMHRAQREVIAVANAQGILMDERDIEAWDRQLSGLSSCGISSTLQDIRARRKTEVELYGVTICRLGKALGIPTPENERLVQRIREIETGYLAGNSN
ncbi:MAG: ketopantoate reductase family protein [Clostridia bacterium]|nr:ketopantoate reductase family protein [Clostridia bacterium]